MNQAMIDEFMAAVRETRTPRVTGEDGHRAMESVAAAYVSAQMGQPVRHGGKETCVKKAPKCQHANTCNYQ